MLFVQHESTVENLSIAEFMKSGGIYKLVDGSVETPMILM